MARVSQQYMKQVFGASMPNTALPTAQPTGTGKVVYTIPQSYQKARTLYNRTTKGQSSLSIAGGYVTEDFLTRLQGQQGMKVYREMSKNDPIIGGILYHMSMRMRTTKWNIKASDSTPGSKELAEIVRASINDMDSPWNYIVHDMLSMMTYGWSLFEPTYKANEKGQIVLNTMEFRGQLSLDKWEFDKKRIATKFFQRPISSFETFEIPLDRAFHLTTTPRRNNPEGESILRTAYRPWFFKKHIEEIEGIGIERDMTGIPHLHFTDDTFDPLSEANIDIVDYAEKLVTNIQKDQQQGVVTYSGMELDILQGRASSINTDKVISRYEQRIALALASQFMIVAFEARGSGTVASEYNDLMLDSFDAWNEILVSVFQEQIVRKLRIFNGLPNDAKVTIQPSRVAQRDKVDFAAYISRLASNGLVQPDDVLEEYIRNQSGLPEKDFETTREVAGSIEQPIQEEVPEEAQQDLTPEQQEEVNQLEKGGVEGYYEVRDSKAVKCDPDGIQKADTERYAIECNGIVVHSQKYASMENAMESAKRYQPLGTISIAKSIGKRNSNHVYRRLMKLYKEN